MKLDFNDLDNVHSKNYVLELRKIFEDNFLMKFDVFDIEGNDQEEELEDRLTGDEQMNFGKKNSSKKKQQNQKLLWRK